jgi:hypothetical protein
VVSVINRDHERVLWYSKTQKSSTMSFLDKIDSTNGFLMPETLRRDTSTTDVALLQKRGGREKRRKREKTKYVMMPGEGAAAASLPGQEGVLPSVNRQSESQNATRGRNRGSFSQKILLAGPDLWLQGTDPELRSLCNLEAKVRGKIVRIPKNMPSLVPNYTVQWYNSGNSGLHVNQLQTTFTQTPVNKNLLLGAIAAYEDQRPTRRRRLSNSDSRMSQQQDATSQQASQSQQSAASVAIVAVHDQRRSMSNTPINDESQLSVPNPPHIQPAPPLDDHDESENESTSSQ